jgi:predicted lipid-binding transport protein (Tim44 family)
MRSLAGGLAGGFLGSLLFGGMGYGGGFGLLDILLFAGVTLAVVAYLRRRSQAGFAGAQEGYLSMRSGDHGGGCGSSSERGTAVEESRGPGLQRGLDEVGVVVAGFDPGRFPEEAMDIFFRIQEAWVEAGKAFVTIHFLANLLDYTVDERSGNLVAGSNEVPVKFEEYWTFVRSTGDASWNLTAIQQAA